MTGPRVLAAARVVTGAVVHRPGWLAHDGRRITAVGAGPGRDVDRDYGDATLAPGFVDLHVHGGGGGSFTEDRASAVRAVAAHRAHGTTTTLASLVTASPEELLRSVAVLAALHDEGVIDGIHLEGPWINPARGGAHDPAHIRSPDPREIRRLLDAGRGAIAVVTVAPEVPGGIDAIRLFVQGGAIAAVGHTDATHAETVRAVEAGARIGTHLLNAMRPLHQREPGAVGALLDDHRVFVELIADGVHVHPALHRLVTRVAPGRTMLVTDAMAASGVTNGDFRLGPVPVSVVDGVAHVAGTTTIAGSTATMDDLFRRAAFDGDAADDRADPSDADLLRAVHQTSTTAARAIGRSDIGSLQVGSRADVVVLDPALRVLDVVRPDRHGTPVVAGGRSC